MENRKSDRYNFKMPRVDSPMANWAMSFATLDHTHRSHGYRQRLHRYMSRPRVDITDLILNGRFGPFDRRTPIDTIHSLLGPSDDWVTYPGIYGYGNICFEAVSIDIDHQLNVQFAFQNPEHFRLPYESWRSTTERSLNKALYDWPDTRFDVELGPFKSGATLDSLYERFFADAEEIEFIEAGPAPSWRMFTMASGISVQFSKSDMNGDYTLYNLMTLHRWGPDCRAKQALNARGRSREF